jgi:hypothetical protein
MAHYITGGHKSEKFCHDVKLPWPESTYPNSGVQRMSFHASPFEQPMYGWLTDTSRIGFFDVTSGPSGITYLFTNPNTAMEFRMRFG